MAADIFQRVHARGSHTLCRVGNKVSDKSVKNGRIFSFIGAWNDVMIPLFFVGGAKWALPLTIYNFYGSRSQQWNLIFADIVITVAPLLVVYIFAQKYIVSGMTAGAVKG